MTQKITFAFMIKVLLGPVRIVFSSHHRKEKISRAMVTNTGIDPVIKYDCDH